MNIACICQNDVAQWDQLDEQELQKITSIEIGQFNVQNDICEISQVSKFENLINIEMRNTIINSAAPLKNCPLLKDIFIECCVKIKQIDFQPSLPYLEELRLIHLKITNLHISSVNHKLKILSLYKCRQMSRLSGLDNCQQLEMLDVRLTAIKQLDMHSKMKRLTKFGVGSKEIPRITELENIQFVQELYISSTKISMLNIPAQMNILCKINAFQCSKLELINGLENCPNLQYLYVNISHLTDLHIPQQLKNLKILNAYGCTHLSKISGLQTCYQLQQLNLDDTKLKLFNNLQYECNHNLCISVPNEEVLIFKESLLNIDVNKITQNTMNVQQLTLLQCSCAELLKQSENESLMTLIIKKFQPHCLTLTNSSQINMMSEHIDNIQQLVLKHNDIRDLSFIKQNNLITDLAVDNCLYLTNIDAIVHCKYVKSFKLINTKVQDFTPILNLNNLHQLKISDNYRQKTAFVLNIPETSEQSLIVKKQNFSKIQVKQTYYQLRKQVGYLYQSTQMYNSLLYLQNIRESRLCVDIIKLMLYYQYGGH